MDHIALKIGGQWWVYRGSAGGPLTPVARTMAAADAGVVAAALNLAQAEGDGKQPAAPTTEGDTVLFAEACRRLGIKKDWAYRAKYQVPFPEPVPAGDAKRLHYLWTEVQEWYVKAKGAQ